MDSNSVKSNSYGANVGYGGTVTDASIHIVYAEIRDMLAEDFVLKIT